MTVETWQEVEKQMQNFDGPIDLFHGTTIENAYEIIRNGFLPEENTIWNASTYHLFAYCHWLEQHQSFDGVLEEFEEIDEDAHSAKKEISSFQDAVSNAIITSHNLSSSEIAIIHYKTTDNKILEFDKSEWSKDGREGSYYNSIQIDVDDTNHYETLRLVNIYIANVPETIKLLTLRCVNVSLLRYCEISFIEQTIIDALQKQYFDDREFYTALEWFYLYKDNILNSTPEDYKRYGVYTP